MKQLILFSVAVFSVLNVAAQTSEGTSNAINLGPLLQKAYLEKQKEQAKQEVVVAENEPKKPLIEVVLNSDVDKDIPATTIKNPNAFAIVIGNRDYAHTASVDYAIHDARAVKNYLLESMGYVEENVFLVENATLRDFNKWFGTDRDFKGRLYNLVYGNDESNTDVFVYYAGHGAPDVNTQTGFFLPIDCETDYINITAYSGDQLFNNLAKINARSTTVVLDACFSGNGIIKGLSAVAIKPKDFSSIPNGVVLSSSSGTEPSAWFEENNHGLFTYYFLKAIHNGNADTDADGNLTANEIYQYASNNVTRKARSLRNLDQHPTIQGDARNNVLVKFSSPSVNDEE